MGLSLQRRRFVLEYHLNKDRYCQIKKFHKYIEVATTYNIHYNLKNMFLLIISLLTLVQNDSVV